MDKDKAYKLADALESGKYKQGKTYLRNLNGEYCCLGVACEINGIDFVKNNDDQFYYLKSYCNSASLPREENKTGITSLGYFKKPIRCRKSKLKPFVSYYNLARLNDAGFSFKFIAKIIRKHYKNIK